MRLLTAGILSAVGLLLVGCASDLPYYLSIKPTDERGPTGPLQCVLPLDQVVKTVVEDLPPDGFMAEDSIRALQRRFELALALSEFELGVSPKRPEQHDELVAKRLEKLLTGRTCKTTVQRTKYGCVRSGPTSATKSSR